jgi:hypothetical protein
VNDRFLRVLAVAGLALIIAVFVALALWVHFDAPCGLYKYTEAGKVPARCFMK